MKGPPPPLPNPPPRLPRIFTADDREARHVLEYLRTHHRNANTQRAYLRALFDFSGFCAARDIQQLGAIDHLVITEWIDALDGVTSRASIKQRLSAVRGVFDWLVKQKVLATNPAGGVHGPRYAPRRGRTHVLSATETRLLLDSIPEDSLVTLRDRCLIALLVYTFMRVGTALALRCEDLVGQGDQLALRTPYRQGIKQEIPCHPELAASLTKFLQAEERSDNGRLLFRSSIGRSGRLSESAMGQSDVYRMIRRRSEAALIGVRVGGQSFRATGLTHYLRNGGRLEIAQRMANLASSRSTGRYAPAPSPPTLADVQRIMIR